GVFSGSPLAGGGSVESFARGSNPVEVWQRGFDHDDVRAFLEIEFDFAHSLTDVRRVHLIGTAIAKLGRRVGGFAERTIEAGRKFRGVGKDRRVDEAYFV